LVVVVDAGFIHLRELGLLEAKINLLLFIREARGNWLVVLEACNLFVEIAMGRLRLLR
jgi:hypothetical protein